MRSQVIRPQSISHTVCPPVSSVTRSPCSTKALLFSKALMKLSLPMKTVNIMSCGTHRHSITRNKSRITGRLKNGCVRRQVGLHDENGVAAYRLVCENVENAQL